MTSTVSTPSITLPPTQDELPCDDGIPMETQRHKMQMDLLLDTLQFWLDQQEEGYIGGNMFIYFSTRQVRNQDFRGPDFFAVLGVPKKERKSWVVWEEGKAPNVVIELLSETTAQQDKERKKEIYQNQLRVPEYFWYDPFHPEDFAGFYLNGGQYRPLEPDTDNSYVSQQLGLKSVQWRGSYKTVETVWLRWATLEGELLPTENELRREAQQQAQQAQQQAQQAQQQAQQAQQEVQQARQEAQQAQQTNEKLAAKLRELGIDPGTV
jgi:Uma2 family endonuclease